MLLLWPKGTEDVLHENDLQETSSPLRIVLDRPGGPVVISLLPSTGYDVVVQAARGTLGFAFDAQIGWHAFASDRVTPFHRRPNTLAWVPPGCEVRSRSQQGGEYLLVDGLDPPTGGAESEQAFSDLVHPDAFTKAAFLRRLLISRANSDRCKIDLAVDTLITVAEERLRGGSVEESVRLTRARLRALDTLIDARMGERLTVPEMAQELGLSLGYFMRIVRSDLGITPHAYLMDRRLARARRELASGRSIADVAAACGFAHQSHLNRAMREMLGLTPTGRPARSCGDASQEGLTDAAP